MGRSNGRKRPKTRRTPRSNPRGVLSVSARGFGFVQTAEGEYFVPASKMGTAFDGDFVEIAPSKVNRAHRQESKEHHETGGRPTARVVNVIMRNHETIVGRYEVAEPFGVVVPEDPRIPYDIFTRRSDAPHVNDGDMVRVRMVEYPTRHTAATGVVEEVLGREEDVRLDAEVVIARHKLETEFSSAALEEAAHAEVDVEGALAQGYRDLRGLTVFTIDPDDAKDFDDAVSLERVDAPHGGAPGTTGETRPLPAGAVWRLGVHIADVSYYVPWNSSIDLDARRRATSVYLADRVVPMLPEALSNEVCSLKPHEPRRAFTVDLWLDDRARLLDADFYPSIIESRARLTYGEAQEAIDADRKGKELTSANGDLTDGIAARIVALAAIARKRSAARTARGGIDFETTEAKVRLAQDGTPLSIELRRKTDATSLIEEAMILANEAVASFMDDSRFPCLYRVHETPSADTLAELVPLLQEFSSCRDLDVSRFVAGSPQEIQRVLANTAGRPEEELVSSLLLRSMKRALYRPYCEPHFGLASVAYTHFTSPIRRYPDLVVHRMLKARLTKRGGDFDQQKSALSWIAEHASTMERTAEAAARESQEMKMCELLSSEVGSSFDGAISGVATYGAFVRLPCTVEGLVPVRSLGDEYFALDPVRRSLTGTDSGRVFRLGQKVRVVLVAVDARRRRLDFRLDRSEERSERRKRR